MSLSACDIGNPAYEISRETKGGSLSDKADIYYANDGESSIEVPVRVDYTFDCYGLLVEVAVLSGISVIPDDLRYDLRIASEQILKSKGVDESILKFTIV
jgi:hypothetical protein